MQTIQKSLAPSLKVLVIIVPLLGIVFLNKVSGIYFLGYFCYILLLFALYRKFTRNSLRRKNTLQFTLAIVAVISAILISVSFLDFTVVETFKKISPFPQNSPYWMDFFNHLLPVVWCALGFTYWLGSRSAAGAVKIAIAGVFLEYSAFNDFLYYLLHGVSLPQRWPWIEMPQFLFGNNITTGQLVFWLIAMFVMAVTILLLPFDAFFVREDSSK